MGRSWKVALTIAVIPMVASAQSEREQGKQPKAKTMAEARTPRECVGVVQNESGNVWNELYKSTDTAVKPLTMEQIEAKVDTARRALALECLSKFSDKAATNVEELNALASLHGNAAQLDKADELISRSLSLSKTTAARIKTLSHAMSIMAAAKSETAIGYRDGYLAKLDQLGNAALAERISGRVYAPGAVPEKSLREAIALVAKAKTPATRAKLGNSAMNAYLALTNVLLDQGQWDAAAAMADTGLKVARSWKLRYTSDLEVLHARLGKPIDSVYASNWFNVPAELDKYRPGTGRVTLIEVTSYW